MNSIAFAWICCAACVGIASRTATVFCKGRPRLFTILALFALVWALLLPYYDSSGSPSELFAAYGGFLLVYIGGLLSREATQDQGGENVVDSIQRVGLLLFLLIASPGVVGLTAPGGGVSITRQQHEIFVATLLDIAGYAAVAYGVWRLCGSRRGIVITIFLGVYSLLEVWYTVVSWPRPGVSVPMPPYLRVFFGVAKLGFTILLCYWVSLHTLSDNDRHKTAGLKGFGWWILRLLGVVA